MANDLLGGKGVRASGQLASGLLLSAAGLFVLAALDSTIFFWLPFGVDAAVMVLARHNRQSAWVYPVVAAAGSLTGSIFMFWTGRKIGEAGIEKHIPKKRLAFTKAAVRKRGAVTIALLGLVPPPFPFTAFVLASGALGLDAARFFTALAMARLVRFGTEAFIATHYGASAFHWMLRR